ncbi:DegT/DnrJ/EryC1/StrS family aminotransferase [Candidatus Amarolinea dominans]|uniref:DegT/DnrJ/EryC1/StrS family aminotransferase n=1 Tax=Candidatus Amarolinea dominans TaxID=3140696 RepID=UPI003136CD3B|nr:DegT/DnrJ/EryC1/StrS family aminotransferase [Anaerolineae bacterium]
MPWKAGRFLPPSATPHTAADLAASLAAAARTGAEAAFARDLTALTGCPSVHLTASGRAAFFLILEAGKRLRPDRREVVLPAYTCPVLAYAAHAAGLRVRLVDMDPLTLDYDRAALERAIGPQTLAVVSVHPLGLPRPLDGVRARAHAAGAFFVDDAAQAFGARGPEPATCTGAQGDAGLFSFRPGKPLSAGRGSGAFQRRQPGRPPRNFRRLAAAAPGVTAPGLGQNRGAGGRVSPEGLVVGGAAGPRCGRR